MAFTEVDEKLLVKAYQAGDERAFDTIVRTQYQALYAHALRRLSQHEAAEDAVQDTLLRAYRALPNLDGDLALKAWLHRILTNVCHDEGNRRRRQYGLVEKMGALPEETADDIADEAVLHDTVRIMSEALEGLPERYREALVLRYVDGLSFREVAEATGVSEENARARVHRGRQALHKIMARLAIIAAFVIPGLKRAQTPAATPATQQAAAAGVGEQAVQLTTQLTMHAATAAPTVTRLAEVASTMPSGTKSAIAAAAVTAVAAVSVPVVANQVRDTERPRAQVASPVTSVPAMDDPITVGGKTVAPSPTTSSTAAPTSTTTSSTLPPSQTNPFGAGVAIAGQGRSGPTITVAPPTTTTTTPAGEPVVTVEGSISGDQLTVKGQGPNADLGGTITVVGEGARTGGLAGRLTIHDDGFASAELTVTIGTVEHAFSYRGNVVERTDDGGTVVYRLAGSYRLVGGGELGLAEVGDLAGTFRRHGATGSLRIELSGPASEGGGDGATAGAASATEDGDQGDAAAGSGGS